MTDKFKPLQVEVRSDEPIERAIKRFTKKVKSDGVIEESIFRRAYEKPSVKRRRKQAAARFVARTQEED